MCRVFGSHPHCRCSSATPQALRHSRFGFCCHGMKYCARILFQTRRDSSYQFEFTVFRNFFLHCRRYAPKVASLCFFFYFFHFWHLSRKHVNFCSRFLFSPAQCFVFPSQSQRSPFPLVPADLFGAGGVSAHIHEHTHTFMRGLLLLRLRHRIRSTPTGDKCDAPCRNPFSNSGLTAKT